MVGHGSPLNNSNRITRALALAEGKWATGSDPLLCSPSQGICVQEQECLACSSKGPATRGKVDGESAGYSESGPLSIQSPEELV